MKYWVKVYDGNTIIWDTVDSTSHENEEGWSEFEPGYMKSLYSVVEGKVIVDPEKQKRHANAASKNDFILSQEISYDEAVNSLLDGKSETRVLSEMLYAVFTYLKSLQQAASVEDSSLSEQGQAAKAHLDLVASNVYAHIESLRETKTQAINDFMPPHLDVEPLYPI